MAGKGVPDLLCLCITVHQWPNFTIALFPTFFGALVPLDMAGAIFLSRGSASILSSDRLRNSSPCKASRFYFSDTGEDC